MAPNEVRQKFDEALARVEDQIKHLSKIEFLARALINGCLDGGGMLVEPDPPLVKALADELGIEVGWKDVTIPPNSDVCRRGKTDDL